MLLLPCSCTCHSFCVACCVTGVPPEGDSRTGIQMQVIWGQGRWPQETPFGGIEKWDKEGKEANCVRQICTTLKNAWCNQLIGETLYLAHSFQGSSPWSVGHCFVPVPRQHLMTGACGRANNAHLEARKQQRKRKGIESQKLLESTSPMSFGSLTRLPSSHYFPILSCR